MGIWDGFGSSVVGGLFSLAGGAYASSSSAKGVAEMNAANAAEAQKNRDWQERMSSTSHTREVADLKNAGLNPILSATGGSGASSPGGSMAVMEDKQIRATPIKAQLANLAANTAKQVEETRLTHETAQRVKFGTVPGTDIPNSTAAKGLSEAKKYYSQSPMAKWVAPSLAMSGLNGLFVSDKKNYNKLKKG